MDKEKIKFLYKQNTDFQPDKSVKIITLEKELYIMHPFVRDRWFMWNFYTPQFQYIFTGSSTEMPLSHVLPH